MLDLDKASTIFFGLEGPVFLEQGFLWSACKTDGLDGIMIRMASGRVEFAYYTMYSYLNLLNGSYD